MRTLWQNMATFTIGSTPIQKERYPAFTNGKFPMNFGVPLENEVGLPKP